MGVLPYVEFGAKELNEDSSLGIDTKRSCFWNYSVMVVARTLMAIANSVL